ncbi:MAG: hypothetical protein K6W08_07365 [Firmicutes bacterium]|nr:hypothetical protein [Bacillota bacterium]
MGRALEVIAGQATAPGTTFTSLTMNSGNSLTIRNAPLDSGVWLLQVWVDAQGAGTFRVRSPKLHDNVQGLRFATTVSDVVPLMPEGAKQRLVPQDVLIAEITGSATAGDIESAAMLIYYENLPGTDARLARWSDIAGRIVNIVTVENTIATGTAGGYSGEEPINAEFDLLKANTDYALLGYTVAQECAVVRWRGADTGNLGVGGPGNETLRHVTSQWFKRLSMIHDWPLIPIFNSANKAGILIDCHQDENGVDVTVTSILAELAAGAPAAPGR